MKKRFRIALAILAVAILAGLILMWVSSREPSYGGRALTAWINDLQAEAPETKNQAREAVRKIDVKGMPLILGLLHSQDSPLKLKFVALANRQSLVKFHFTPAEQRHRLGLMACDALGPSAQAAVPVLSELFNTSHSDPGAAYVLARIGGPQATSALTQALQSTNKAIRLNASTCLDLMRSNSSLVNLSKATSADELDYTRRRCEYNLLVLRAAYKDGVARGLIHVSGKPPATPLGEFPPSLSNSVPQTVAPVIIHPKPGYE